MNILEIWNSYFFSTLISTHSAHNWVWYQHKQCITDFQMSTYPASKGCRKSQVYGTSWMFAPCIVWATSQCLHSCFTVWLEESYLTVLQQKITRCLRLKWSTIWYKCVKVSPICMRTALYIWTSRYVVRHCFLLYMMLLLVFCFEQECWDDVWKVLVTHLSHFIQWSFAFLAMCYIQVS